MINDRNSPSRASMADALDGVNMNSYTRESAKANMRKAEAIVDGAESIVRAVGAALARAGQLSAAWRLKSVPRA